MALQTFIQTLLCDYGRINRVDFSALLCYTEQSLINNGLPPGREAKAFVPHR